MKTPGHSMDIDMKKSEAAVMRQSIEQRRKGNFMKIGIIKKIS